MSHAEDTPRTARRPGRPTTGYGRCHQLGTRVHPELIAALAERSAQTGRPRWRIVEDALRAALAAGEPDP